MLAYIDDKEVEELENDYAYVEEYEPRYEEEDCEEESESYEIAYDDINDFSL